MENEATTAGPMDLLVMPDATIERLMALAKAWVDATGSHGGFYGTYQQECSSREKSAEAKAAFETALHELRGEQDATITLPREMDEDLYYVVGGALGAQSPEQCGRADGLWAQLVARADFDAALRHNAM